MDINKLNAFLCVAKHQNFTKASEELFISQPALSKKIADFEHELNAKLLIRDNRNVVLTPAGIELYNEAPLILNIMDDLEKRVQDISNYPSQKISIACSGMEYERFTPLINKFREEHPDVEITLQWCNPTLARQLIYSKMIDFSFLLSIENHDDCIGQLPFFYDQLDIIMSNYHPLANKEIVHFEELTNNRYIAINSGTNQLPFNNIVNHFKKIGVEFKGGITVADSLDSMVLQVSAGLGIGMLSHQVSKIYGRLVRFIPLKENFMCIQTDLVWNNNRPNPAKDIFIDFVRSENASFPLIFEK